MSVAILRPAFRDGVRMAAWSADPRPWSSTEAALVASRGAELMRAALLITGNRHDAEDAVQDAVIAVSAAWPRVTERGAYQYLRTAVVRRAIENRRPPTADIDLYDTPIEDERFLRLERHRRFVDLLSGLPPQQRAVLVLRFHLDLDDRAIARTLGISTGTVRSNTSRALAKLRDQLAGTEVQQ